MLKDYLDSDQKNKLQVVASLGDYPAGTEVTAVSLADLTVTVNNSHSNQVNDGVYDFVRPVNDYAVKDITDLWYSWAKYYVGLFPADFSSTATANLNYYVPPGQTTPSTQPLNEITLTSAPLTGQELQAGMTVTGTGLPAGTTILSMTGPDGAPISKADAIGDNIYLSMIPGTSTPASQQYTFGRRHRFRLGLARASQNHTISRSAMQRRPTPSDLPDPFMKRWSPSRPLYRRSICPIQRNWLIT